MVAGILLGAPARQGAAASALLAALCALLLALRGARNPSGPFERAAFSLLWLAAGFFLGQARIARPARLALETFRALPPGTERADAVDGVLADFWSGDPPRARTTLRAERLRVRGVWRPFPAEVSLFVSGSTPVVALADKGDRILAVGHLEPEEPPASVRDLPLPWPVFRLSVKSALRIEKRRTTLAGFFSIPNRVLYALLPPVGSRGLGFDRDVRGPLAALLLGRTADLDRGMVARYRRGGLYHLLVVSGLHVALAVGLLLLLFFPLRVEGKPRDALLVVAVLLIVLVGGANPPAVRAGLVFTLFLAARLCERPVSGVQAIGLSALILFLAAPRQLYSVGTILTFSAVIGIALFAGPIRRRLPVRPAALFAGLATALAAQAATAPILFWRFNLVAAAAWLTAPVAIPLSAALLAVGALLLALFALGLVAGPIAAIFGAGCRLLELLAESTAGAAYLRPTPPLLAILLVGALALAAATGPRRLRAAALLLALGLFLALAVWPGSPGPQRGFSVEALDVGQGDAILIRWARHALLVDGGGPFDLEAVEFGRTRLLPKLLDRGVTGLDGVLLTHPHPDHALGLFAILQELPVGSLYRSTGRDEGELFARLEALAREREIPVVPLAAGAGLDWPDARLMILHSGGRPRKRDAVNNQSVVGLFVRDGRSALLTGDIGAPTEEEMLLQGLTPRADVLKVAHHGSRGSSRPPFVSSVSPRAALLSCGRRNRFGHPAEETVRTLAHRRVRLLRTDQLSDVRIELLPEGTRLHWRGVL
jgi:competence protein ComEC